MKIFQHKSLGLSLLAAAVLALTACGGSGSSDDSPVISPSTNPGTNPSTNTTNATTGIVGHRMSVSFGTADAAEATQATSAINKVFIDGKEVDFIPSGFSTNILNMQNVNLNGTMVNRVGGSSNLAYTRYGFIREGATGTPYLFAQGQVATNMPSTGTATYKGNGTQLSGGQYGLVEAKFDVNFGQKTLTGSVGNVNLAANITGTSFTGNKNGIYTKGNFYGENAAELGGIYYNSNNPSQASTVAGAFGAKK